eukprot:TRINITY_DN4559_c0_g1_i1.p1 TRINITY_DN4559_c0_g1~~TRINITY_DN4559_c0_g1_i1.p1  ORF type:complete len:378 (+),score=59.95 TRINITY_DN4559_c0_g1_i1:100-1233(+)
MTRKDKKKGKDRAFDMSKYTRRQVALKYSYLGGQYAGLAIQDHVDNTVEAVLFTALKKVKLVTEEEKIPNGYSRCGRTDKGVSALGQVSSMSLRCGTPDLDYTTMLNNVLPADIRIHGWSYVDDSFNARFACSGRIYKYFFTRGDKNMDILKEASKKLVGEHDFRNFAKLDVVNVSNFVRKIYAINITHDEGTDSGVITIVGTAFLYHQVRCMVAVLFDIACGNEEPKLIDRLLDIKETPARPTYQMAGYEGLVLWDCLFPAISWQSSDLGLANLKSHFSKAYHAAMVAPLILKAIHSAIPEPPPGSGRKQPEHVPYEKRPAEMSYDQKCASLNSVKRSKLEENLKKQDRDADIEIDECDNVFKDRVSLEGVDFSTA